jgi:hypothetical protein
VTFLWALSACGPHMPPVAPTEPASEPVPIEAAPAPAAEPVPVPPPAPRAQVLPDDPDWIGALATDSSVTDEQLARIRQISAASGWLTTGRAEVTTHPMTPDECRERRSAAGLVDLSPDAAACGHPYMVRAPGDGEVCIDQYEFPGVPCAYPVVWVRAREAAEICEALGKRLCDASEWEDACADRKGPVEDLSTVAGMEAGAAQRKLRAARNLAVDTSWAYGPERKTGNCGMASTKNAACDGSNAKACGSNTYPTGAFPLCGTPRGVYDQHGNAAEHMSLPLAPDQRGNATGVTEMKGSWFIFDTYQAHPDHCRWRAPYWHGTPVRDLDSHRNYHLGFRCCADAVGTAP